MFHRAIWAPSGGCDLTPLGPYEITAQYVVLQLTFPDFIVSCAARLTPLLPLSLRYRCVVTHMTRCAKAERARV